MGNFADLVKNRKPTGAATVFFTGQAGFIIKDYEGLTYAVDVYFSDCCEREFGFKRLTPKLLSPTEIVFDYVITTHSHSDHFDTDAMPDLMKPSATRLITTFSAKEKVKKLALDESRVLYVGREDEIKLKNITLTAVFCDHGELDKHAVGYLIDVGGKRVYAVGDSAFRPEKISDIRDVNLMFVPINGAFGNLNEAEAVEYVKIIKPEIAVPCHYGNFAEHGGSVEKYNELFANAKLRCKNLNMKTGEYVDL